MLVRRRDWISFAVAAILSLAIAPAAHAAFGSQDRSSAPTDNHAGANSDVDIHIGFSRATTSRT
jgi:hypothetical protein